MRKLLIAALCLCAAVRAGATGIFTWTGNCTMRIKLFDNSSVVYDTGSPGITTGTTINMALYVASGHTLWIWNPTDGTFVNVTYTGQDISAGAPACPAPAAPEPSRCWKVTVINNGNGSLYLSGAMDASSPPTPQLYYPGDSLTVSGTHAGVVGTATTTPVIKIWQWRGVGTDYPVAELKYTSGSGDYVTNCPPSSANVVLNWDGYNFNAYNTGDTNTPIDWAGSDGSATNRGLALENTLRKQAEILHGDMRDGFASVRDAINTGNGKLDTANGKLDTANGHLAGIFANTKQNTNQLGAVEGVMRGWTNMFGVTMPVFNAIMTNTAASAGAGVLSTVASNTANTAANVATGNGTLTAIWNATSNTWFQAGSVASLVAGANGRLDGVNARLDATAYNIKDNTAGALSHLGAINSATASTVTKLNEANTYLYDMQRMESGAIDGMPKQIRDKLTTIAAELDRTNFLSAEMLSELQKLNLTTTNVYDGMNLVSVRMDALTNLVNAIKAQGEHQAGRDLAATNYLRQAVDVLGAISTNTANTNAISLTVSNYNVVSNALTLNLTNNVNLTNNLSLTNLLTVVVTNQFPTNGGTMDISGLLTNYGQAAGFVEDRVPELGTIRGWADSISSIVVPFNPPGEAPDMSINLGLGGTMHSIDLNPVHKWPMAFTLFKCGMTFLTVFLFCEFLAVQLGKAIQTMASTDGGGVPNVGSPFEAIGNTIGLGVYGATILIVCTTWAVILTALGLVIAAGVTALLNEECRNMFGGIGPIALYLLDHMLPVSIIFASLVAGLAFRYTVCAVVATGAIIRQCLPTK